MGQATGKLTISHVDNKNKTEAPINADGDVAQPINTGQPIATAKSNITAEAPVANDQPAAVEHGPNGSVNATDGHDSPATDAEKPKEEKSKKTKNPLAWIHRRLSKRLSTSKKGSDKAPDDNAPSAEPEERTEEAAAGTPSVAATTELVESAALSATPLTAAEHQQVVEAASSLVDQVLNTAMIQQLSEQTVEHTPEVAPITTEVIEQQHEPTHEPAVEHPVCPTEQVIELVPQEQTETQPPEETTPHVPEQIIDDQEHVSEVEAEPQPELPPQPEEVDMSVEEHVENEQPVLDTNNTNIECELSHQPHGEFETTPIEPPVEHEVSVDGDANHVNGHDLEHHDDAVAAKLANLELTNGHSEHHSTTNEVDGMHSDVIVNGD